MHSLRRPTKLHRPGPSHQRRRRREPGVYSHATHVTCLHGKSVIASVVIQTDGLVERFNKTLKAMPRKTAISEGRDWDKLLPYVLFAYREVSQASTGFSPFELLYGRPVRGPLDILLETWEELTNGSESIVSYVLTMRDRLAKMSELVQENLERAQATQKKWYDRTARAREFTPGDKVLVLLPNKLRAQWQGPYIHGCSEEWGCQLCC